MVDPPEQPSEPGAAEALRGHAEALADAIEAALPGWVVRSVATVAEAWAPGGAEALAGEAERAGREAREEVGPRVRALLMADVDEQSTGPLDLCRAAVIHPTRVLAAAGVPPVVRDEFSERVFPDDAYGLSPATFADLDPSVATPGLVWGAAKAHVVLNRRRAEGNR